MDGKIAGNMRGHARKHDFWQMSEDSESLAKVWKFFFFGGLGKLVLSVGYGLELGLVVNFCWCD